MQLHAQAQAGQQADNLANLVNGPPGMPGLPPGALGLPPGLQGLPHGLNIPTSLSSSLLQGLPTSIAASLGGLGGPNPLHPALSMLKPQLPIDPKREDEIRKSLSESNGKFINLIKFWDIKQSSSNINEIICSSKCYFPATSPLNNVVLML